MHAARFPGESFPEVPALSLDRPEGWQDQFTRGSLLAIMLDRGPESFSPNAVATHARYGTDVDLAQSDAAVEAYISGIEGVEIINRRSDTRDAREWNAIEFTYEDAAIGTVIQIIAITVVKHVAATDVITITATTDTAAMDEIVPVLRQVVASATVEAR